MTWKHAWDWAPFDSFFMCSGALGRAIAALGAIWRATINLEVVVELSGFSLNTVPIIILDEFDKLADRGLRTLIANTIKNLSDRSVRATVIVVGMADSVGDLIEEHESIVRCLRQIPMQRMNFGELKEIIGHLEKYPPMV